MHANTNHRRFSKPPMAVTLRLQDLKTGSAESAVVADRDEEWEEFLALALPRGPVDEDTGTPWRRVPVMLSY